MTLHQIDELSKPPIPRPRIVELKHPNQILFRSMVQFNFLMTQDKVVGAPVKGRSETYGMNEEVARRLHGTMNVIIYYLLNAVDYNLVWDNILTHGDDTKHLKRDAILRSSHALSNYSPPNIDGTDEAIEKSWSFLSNPIAYQEAERILNTKENK